MGNHRGPSFSHIVCSSDAVRAPFAAHGPTAIWWRAILWLHGKPVEIDLSGEERRRRIADGFRFYAGLYRLVALVFLTLSALLFLIGSADGVEGVPYWSAASLLTGIYLWAVSGFGCAGAASFAAGHREGTTSLVCFMVMIVAFLSMFVAVVSALCRHMSSGFLGPNLLSASALFVLGVGSYMIEIVCLVAERT